MTNVDIASTLVALVFMLLIGALIGIHIGRAIARRELRRLLSVAIDRARDRDMLNDALIAAENGDYVTYSELGLEQLRSEIGKESK